MKKAIGITVAIILIIGIIILLVCPPVFVSGSSDVYVVFQYGSKDIYEKVSDSEAQQVTQILNAHITFDDPVPSCGFDDNIALIIGDKRFCIARDNCPTVRYNGKYFNVSQKQIDTLRNIMRSYGAYFPCV